MKTAFLTLKTGLFRLKTCGKPYLGKDKKIYLGKNHKSQCLSHLQYIQIGVFRTPEWRRSYVSDLYGKLVILQQFFSVLKRSVSPNMRRLSRWDWRISIPFSLLVFTGKNGSALRYLWILLMTDRSKRYALGSFINLLSSETIKPTSIGLPRHINYQQINPSRTTRTKH